MKNTARFQALLFFLCAAASQTVQQSIAAGHELRTTNVRSTQLTTEQKSRVATDTLIKYFEQMIEKNVLGITGLERLAESPSVINPILPEQYHTSDLVDTFKTQLDTLLEKGKDWFDLARNKVWAQAKIQELERRERTRQHVHEETREVHIPMRFIEIPAGKYEDLITHEEFEIQPGAEIQETPVTQLQWAQIMGENPSHFVDGNDAEEVSVGGKKIKMRPDAPVENVSYNQVQEFITKLNEHDKNNTNYTYALPSVQEYQALLQSALGSNWLEQIQRIKTCGDTEKTCTVTSGEYMLTSNKKRVFGFVGSVWQWTQDLVDLGKYEGHDVDAHLVFGGSYATHELVGMTTITSLLRPIWCSKTIDKNIGVRLVRHAKPEACERIVVRYSHDVLSWNEKDVDYDQVWHWNKKLGNLFSGADEVAWIIEHKSDYPQETQHTIDVLLQQVPAGQDAVVYLKAQTSISLRYQQIQDVSPLAMLTNLQTLKLDYNRIQDVSPLTRLINLYRIDLFYNQIQDVSPLAKLTNLKWLDLGGNQIQDVSPLTTLTNLQALDLHNNKIQDVPPLARLTNLQTLDLGDTQIQDVSSLARLTNLQTLYFGNNRIQDVSPLAMLTNLSGLYLYNNQIQDVSSLATLTNLHRLDLRNNPIKDVSSLEALRRLGTNIVI